MAIETRHIYTLHEEIASGGMATVRFGLRTSEYGFSRIVAIKQLHPEHAENQEFVAMFRDEMRVASRIFHPNVVPILDLVSSNGELFLIMEYAHGISVAQLIKMSQRAIPPEIATTIILGVLHGLHGAHQACAEDGQPLEIVHRDVTPQNIMVGVDGTSRIVDFGIAHALGRLQTTQFGQIKGKVAYMAPEQLNQGLVDRRVDIYSTSVVLWEMLTGRKLFGSRRGDKATRRILAQPVENPGFSQSGISDDLAEIVLRGLQSLPEDRFATAREMAVALEQRTATVSATELGDWVKKTWGTGLDDRIRQVAVIERSQNGPSVASESNGEETATRPFDKAPVAAGLALEEATVPGRPRNRPGTPAFSETDASTVQAEPLRSAPPTLADSLVGDSLLGDPRPAEGVSAETNRIGQYRSLATRALPIAAVLGTALAIFLSARSMSSRVRGEVSAPKVALKANGSDGTISVPPAPGKPVLTMLSVSSPENSPHPSTTEMSVTPSDVNLSADQAKAGDVLERGVPTPRGHRLRKARRSTTTVPAIRDLASAPAPPAFAPPPAAEVASGKACDPPFNIDASGIKRFKLMCL